MRVEAASRFSAVLIALLPQFAFAGTGFEGLSPETCAVTVAAPPTFVTPHPSERGRFWYGSEVLALKLWTDGWWHGSPTQNYRNKVFWYSAGYDGSVEGIPDLTVTGRQLDADNETAIVSRPTNAKFELGTWAMLVLVDFPSAGCWEVTGIYGGQSLTFVVLVGDHKHVAASDA